MMVLKIYLLTWMVMTNFILVAIVITSLTCLTYLVFIWKRNTMTAPNQSLPIVTNVNMFPNLVAISSITKDWCMKTTSPKNAIYVRKDTQPKSCQMNTWAEVTIQMAFFALIVEKHSTLLVHSKGMNCGIITLMKQVDLFPVTSVEKYPCTSQLCKNIFKGFIKGKKKGY